MKILRLECRRETIPLTRPYAIASHTTSAVEVLFLRIVTDCQDSGIGAASPAESITGESAEACELALRDAAPDLLIGRDALEFLPGEEDLGLALDPRLARTPAARAALDMALHDLVARRRGVPVVDLLGRRCGDLPTSITIGILDARETLAEASEHIGRGFTCLKVKMGQSVEEDLERLTLLRDRLGPGIRIRVDANEGYGAPETLEFHERSARLDLEFIEQPMPAAALATMRFLPEALRRGMAMDESLQDEDDALALVEEPAVGRVFVQKLMKSGGIAPCLAIADIAQRSGVDLMWGCMDESAVSIAAALHAAYATPATRFLDLDGSFDLASDPALRGFSLEGGVLSLTGEPGLGVGLLD